MAEHSLLSSRHREHTQYAVARTERDRGLEPKRCVQPHPRRGGGSRLAQALLHGALPERPAEQRVRHGDERLEILFWAALVRLQPQRPVLLEEIDARYLRAKDSVGPVDDEARHILHEREARQRLEELVCEEDLCESALELLVRLLQRLLRGLEPALVAPDLVVCDLEFHEELLLLLAALLGDKQVPHQLRAADPHQLHTAGFALRKRGVQFGVFGDIDDQVETGDLEELLEVGCDEHAQLLGKAHCG